MKRFLPVCALVFALLAPPAVARNGEVDMVFVGDVMVAEVPGQIIAKGLERLKRFCAGLKK